MAKHSDIQEKLRKEILKNSIEKVKEIEYLHYFIKEILRIYLVVSYIPPKITLKDIQFDDYFIPKNTKIGINIRGIHHSKKIYGDPEIFRPERWSEKEQSKNKIPNNSWIPFSSGSRTCIGINFSLMEQKIFIFNLLTNFKINLIDLNAEIKTNPNSGMLQGPMKMKIEFEKISSKNLNFT